MKFPDRQNYVQALINAQSSFVPEIVRTASIDLIQGSNKPNLILAGQSHVIKIKDKGGRFWALKLFKGRFDKSKFDDIKKRYTALSEVIKTPGYSCFLESHFFVNGVSINGSDYPILIMEWASGVRLDDAIKKLIRVGNKKDLNNLAGKLAALALKLKELKIGHGDIHFQNIIVDSSGSLVLLDYDDIWIKGKIERDATVWGNPQFQHPLRETAPIHGILVDNFSFWISIISIYLIICEPQSWEIIDQDGTADQKILFGEEDFKKPEGSKVFQMLQKSGKPEVHYWLAVILNDLISVENLEQVPSPDVNTQILYNKYTGDKWKADRFTMYDPKARSFVKKN